MSTIEQPTIAHVRELSRVESETILTRNHVGRIAFSTGEHVDIQPIHYVYKDGWIYGRTSKGSKLDTIAQNMLVAFEVDEVVAIFEWRSVVVKGEFYIMTDHPGPEPDPTDTSAREDPVFAHGVELLRSFLPDTLLSSDPVPFRYSVFRIHLDEVTGREARPRVASKDRKR